MRLNKVNSLTHLLNTDDSDELNIIRHSPYSNDEYLLKYSTFHKKLTQHTEFKLPKSAC